MKSVDFILLGALPYAAIVAAISVALIRYFRDRYSYSSLSSQFLENRQLFFGSPAFHYGIIVVLLGHLIGFLFPGAVLAFNGSPGRLYLLEATALAFGILALVGICVLIVRRFTNPRVKVVTTGMDTILVILLLTQILTGLYIALTYRWGSSWYVASAVPYLRSLCVFNPQIGYVADLPHMAKLHIINAFVLMGVYGFTRLVHVFAFPITYLWRPYQLVVWDKNPEEEEAGL